MMSPHRAPPLFVSVARLHRSAVAAALAASMLIRDDKEVVARRRILIRPAELYEV